MLISLLILPGTGQRDVQLPEGSTVNYLIESQNLHGRQIILNGVTVPSTEYSRVLVSGDEVAATTSVKGA